MNKACSNGGIQDVLASLVGFVVDRSNDNRTNDGYVTEVSWANNRSTHNLCLCLLIASFSSAISFRGKVPNMNKVFFEFYYRLRRIMYTESYRNYYSPYCVDFKVRTKCNRHFIFDSGHELLLHLGRVPTLSMYIQLVRLIKDRFAPKILYS